MGQSCDKAADAFMSADPTVCCAERPSTEKKKQNQVAIERFSLDQARGLYSPEDTRREHTEAPRRGIPQVFSPVAKAAARDGAARDETTSSNSSLVYGGILGNTELHGKRPMLVQNSSLPHPLPQQSGDVPSGVTPGLPLPREPSVHSAPTTPGGWRGLPQEPSAAPNMPAPVQGPTTEGQESSKSMPRSFGVENSSAPKPMHPRPGSREHNSGRRGSEEIAGPIFGAKLLSGVDRVASDKPRTMSTSPLTKLRTDTSPQGALARCGEVPEGALPHTPVMRSRRRSLLLHEAETAAEGAPPNAPDARFADTEGTAEYLGEMKTMVSEARQKFHATHKDIDSRKERLFENG